MWWGSFVHRSSGDLWRDGILVVVWMILVSPQFLWEWEDHSTSIECLFCLTTTHIHTLIVCPLQLLRMVTLPEKRWRARPGGGAARRNPSGPGQTDEDEEGLESGDCDDEDECTGVSGLGPPPRRKRLRIFAGEWFFFLCFLLFNCAIVNYIT